jgi:ribonuclease G
MSEEILVNVTPRETRVALLENGSLQEVMIERSNSRGLVGNIYKGRVSRVLPGMQAAFIDIGLARTAFLHASDIARAAHAENELPAEGPANIRDLVHEGKEILVQVLKDPLGTKGARLTTHVSIPSRYLVYLPTGNGIGLSARIENEQERQRLQNLVGSFTTEGSGGYIVRTAGEDAPMDALRADMLFLSRLWESIRESFDQAEAGRLVHEDLPLPVRILRDMMGEAVEQVRVDAEAVYERMKGFADMFIPELSPRVQLYAGQRPVFDMYGVDDEIQRALQRRVALKSGGYLIIDQTEAMTTIDVNTGGFVGHRNLEETILKTNLEAAQAIARQLRLRNLGGIIIIDFIDMDSVEHRDLVLQALARSLVRDPAKNHICEVSALGLVEMTRKRTRESLEHVLCEPCPTCSGRGSLKSAETVCFDIFREILREAGQYEVQELLVLASQNVVDLLLDEESASLAEVEEIVGRPVRLQVETQYNQEQFDVVPM